LDSCRYIKSSSTAYLVSGEKCRTFHQDFGRDKSFNLQGKAAKSYESRVMLMGLIVACPYGMSTAMQLVRHAVPEPK
jgi:hypothetical protein